MSVPLEWFTIFRTQNLDDFYVAQFTLADIAAAHLSTGSAEHLLRLQALIRAAYWVGEANCLKNSDFFRFASAWHRRILRLVPSHTPRYSEEPTLSTDNPVIVAMSNGSLTFEVVAALNVSMDEREGTKTRALIEALAAAVSMPSLNQYREQIEERLIGKGLDLEHFRSMLQNFTEAVSIGVPFEKVYTQFEAICKQTSVQYCDVNESEYPELQEYLKKSPVFKHLIYEGYCIKTKTVERRLFPEKVVKRFEYIDKHVSNADRDVSVVEPTKEERRLCELCKLYFSNEGLVKGSNVSHVQKVQ